MFTSAKIRAKGRVLCATLLLLAVWPGSGNAQKLASPAKGFKAAEYFPPPHETQMQSLLQSATVQILENDLFLLTDVTLQTFSENGAAELLIKAPQSFYDRETKCANSPGPLRVLTADGKFWIDGEGYFFRQTNSNLVISNRVHAMVDPGMLNSASGTGGNTNTSKNAASAIEINSGQFNYNAGVGQGLYAKDVRVFATNQMTMTSQKLAFKLPFKERQLESIHAEQEVVVDYGGVHGSGQSAVYSAATGLIHMTGNPAWKSEDREGRGDQLIIDRTNRIFRAEGNAWVRMPAQALSISQLLSQSNSVASGSVRSTNQFVEVVSDYHEFRTNWAEFGQHVKVEERVDNQVRGTMTCGQMNVTYIGTNQLDRLVAWNNVIIKNDTNLLKGGRAVFQGTNSILEMTEKPSWANGLREGKGEVIRINTATNEMLVRGNASMRLPAQELARAADPRSASTNTPTGKTGTNQWAEVFSEEYTLRPQTVQFRGGVYATHPQMNWACETLTVMLPPEGGQVDHIVAQQAVVFDMLDGKGQKLHGTGDKTVYTYTVSGGTTNDVLELTGMPAVLQSTNGTTRNKIIIFDRLNHVLKTPGDYSISGLVPNQGSNALMLPKAKLTK